MRRIMMTPPPDSKTTPLTRQPDSYDPKIMSRGNIPISNPGVSEDNFETVGRKGVLGRGPKPDPGSGFQEIPLLDESDPLSVASLVSPLIRQWIKVIPPKAFTMYEHELRLKAGITEVEEQLRLSFWDEYAYAQDARCFMNMNRVYNRICTKMHFYESVVREPYRLAYILTPPRNYVYRMREMLELAHRRMREVLELPIMDKKKNPNVKLISEMVKITVLLENRVMGAVKQKLEVESKSVNVNVEAGGRKGYFDVEDEIKDIEKQLNDLRSPGHTSIYNRQIETKEDVDAIAETIEKPKREIAAIEDGAGFGEEEEGAGVSAPASVRDEDVPVAEDVP